MEPMKPATNRILVRIVIDLGLVLAGLIVVLWGCVLWSYASRIAWPLTIIFAAGTYLSFLSVILYLAGVIILTAAGLFMIIHKIFLLSTRKRKLIRLENNSSPIDERPKQKTDASA